MIGCIAWLIVSLVSPVYAPSAQMDISDHAEYSGLVGKKVVLSGRDYFVYSDETGAVFVDGVHLHMDEIKLLATLRDGTEVRIEKILRVQKKFTGVTAVEVVPLVSFRNLTNKMESTATIDFRLLNGLDRFYKMRIFLTPCPGFDFSNNDSRGGDAKMTP